MREIVFFIASLAGAAIMTALAILIHPDSPFWRWFLWGGIAVFAACAIVLLLDWIWPGGKIIVLVGIATGVALFMVFTIAFFAQRGNGALPDYIYVIPNGFDQGPFRLAVINPGKNPVINASLRIFDAHNVPASMAASHIDRIGDIDSGYLDLNVAPVPAGYYQIDIRSRGGRFVEMLQIFDQPQNGHRFKLAIGIAGKVSRLPPSDPDM